MTTSRHPAPAFVRWTVAHASALALAATTVASCGPFHRAPMPDRRAIDSLFSPFSAPAMPGASVIVIRGDEVVFRAAYGLADVERGTPATTGTHYRLASLTKQFTAMAVLLLIEDGALTLDTPVRTVLPELPAHAGGVTIRHLLTHTSGLWDYEEFVADTQSYQVKDRDALSLVAARADSLYFAPGAAWRYSNTGYALLALVVERVSKQRFPAFLRERIFAPAGMPSTVAHEDGADTVVNRAWGYTVRQGGAVRSDQSSTSAVLGDGGIYSSVDELAKWIAALDARRFVGDVLWRQATTSAVLTSGAPASYGFGWFVETYHGRTRLRHHGETMGFTNAISRFPDERLTIIVLTNRSDSAPWEIVDRLSDLYLASALKAK